MHGYRKHIVDLDIGSIMVLGTAVPSSVLMIFAVLCPRTYDRWIMRTRNAALLGEISAVPRNCYPQCMTDVEVAHAIGTMSRREITIMLEQPGLEAALHSVFHVGSDGHKGGTDTSSVAGHHARPKKLVL